MFEDFENRMGFWKDLGSNFTINYSGSTPSFLSSGEMWQSMDGATTQTLAAWENGWVLTNNPDGTMTANPKYTSGLPSETIVRVPVGPQSPNSVQPSTGGGVVVTGYGAEGQGFDFALTPTNRVFMADVTKSGIYKWTNGAWADAKDPNWATDTRTWDYGEYTITQTSKKQVHDDEGDQLWYKYQTTTTATHRDGSEISNNVGLEFLYDDNGNKFSDIDKDRNTDANAMQAYLDDYDPSAPNSGSGGGTTGSKDPNGCASENRDINTDNTCGDCKTGYSEDAAGACIADVAEEEEKTNWLLWGGIAAVAAFAFMG